MHHSVIVMHLLAFCLFIGIAVANDDIFIQLKRLDFTSSPAIRAVKLAGGLLEDEGGMLWRQARRRAISTILKEHARKAQAPIIAELEESRLPYKSFWINNSIWVHGASPMFQMLLLAKFKAAGKQLAIVPDRIVAHIPKPPSVAPSKPFLGFSSLYQRSLFEGEDEGPAWNLRVCKVPEAWRMSRGAKVTVATIDTGVFAEHAELKASYRGSKTGSHAYNWFDPQRKSTKPDDDVGHGTHTMGTIVGAAAGVAPEAQWISARGCTPKGCTQHDLLASAQWVMCPTGPDGVEDCDQGADLVSNSWGTEPTDGALEWFQPIVKAWIVAGIVPVFAIGNAGPACGSTGAPGNYANVIAVGSTGPSNMLSPFSSRGPCPLLGSKPDLVAPGEKIMSASHTSKASLVPMSGTSMATPHVAGIVALMLSLKPSLDAVAVARILRETANSKCVIKPLSGTEVCKGIPWNQFPQSHHYGAGMVDAEAALKAVMGSA